MAGPAGRQAGTRRSNLCAPRPFFSGYRPSPSLPFETASAGSLVSFKRFHHGRRAAQASGRANRPLTIALRRPPPPPLQQTRRPNTVPIHKTLVYASLCCKPPEGAAELRARIARLRPQRCAPAASVPLPPLPSPPEIRPLAAAADDGRAASRAANQPGSQQAVSASASDSRVALRRGRPFLCQCFYFLFFRMCLLHSSDLLYTLDYI